MLSFALRIGPLVWTMDLNRVEDVLVEEDDEPELLFHGEPVVGDLVR